MPRRPPHPCGKALCAALVQGRFCTPHQLEWDRTHTQARGTTAQRGYGAPWKAYSRAYLRGHPYCVDCLGRGIQTASAETDHIKPVRGPSDPLFWKPSNHQALCSSCHSRKTVVTDHRGIGRRGPA